MAPENECEWLNGDLIQTRLALRDLFLAVTPPDTDTVDNVALFGFVAKAASLVGAGGAGGTVDDVQLAVLPAPKSQNSRFSIP